MWSMLMSSKVGEVGNARVSGVADFAHAEGGGGNHCGSTPKWFTGAADFAAAEGPRSEKRKAEDNGGADDASL